MQLSGTVALVTGASGGIGAAVCARLADRGARILAHGRDRQRTAAVAEGVGGLPIVADLDSAAGVREVADAARNAYGRVDVLVNNAGAGWAGPFTDLDADELRRVVQVDLSAPLELTRLLLPGMVERGHGHVCFVGSVAGRTGVAGEAVYAAAKGGLDAFAESLRLEADGSGVGVSVVVPAAVRTGFFEHRGKAYDRRFPRPVEPVDVASAVVRAIESGRAEIWVPSWPRMATVVRALAPGPYRLLAGRLGSPVRLRAPGDRAPGDRDGPR